MVGAIASIIGISADPVIIIVALLAAILINKHAVRLTVLAGVSALLTVFLSNEPVWFIYRFIGASIISYVAYGIRQLVKKRSRENK
jgi:hypothetical protein